MCLQSVVWSGYVIRQTRFTYSLLRFSPFFFCLQLLNVMYLQFPVALLTGRWFNSRKPSPILALTIWLLSAMPFKVAWRMVVCRHWLLIVTVSSTWSDFCFLFLFFVFYYVDCVVVSVHTLEHRSQSEVSQSVSQNHRDPCDFGLPTGIFSYYCWYSGCVAVDIILSTLHTKDTKDVYRVVVTRSFLLNAIIRRLLHAQWDLSNI